MVQIRNSVFETNSSSTHSLTMCSEDEFNKWKAGELLFNSWNDCFVENITLNDYDKEQAREYYKTEKGPYWKEWEQLSEKEIKSWYTKYAKNNLLLSHDYDLKTYDSWSQDYNLEHFVHYYTSPSGDKIVAFGKYGYDG